MLAEKQVVGGDGPLNFPDAHIVERGAATLDIRAGLPLAGRQAGLHQQFNERHSGTGQATGFQGMGRHLSEQFVEGAFTDARQIATKEDFAGTDRFLSRRLSMN